MKRLNIKEEWQQQARLAEQSRKEAASKSSSELIQDIATAGGVYMQCHKQTSAAAELFRRAIDKAAASTSLIDTTYRKERAPRRNMHRSFQYHICRFPSTRIGVYNSRSIWATGT